MYCLLLILTFGTPSLILARDPVVVAQTVQVQPSTAQTLNDNSTIQELLSVELPSIDAPQPGSPLKRLQQKSTAKQKKQNKPIAKVQLDTPQDIIQNFKDEKLPQALSDRGRLTREEQLLEKHLERVLSEPYEHSSVSGALAAWAKVHAQKEEAEKTVQLLKSLSPEMENPVTTLKTNALHMKRTQELMEKANFDLVQCAAHFYNKQRLRSLFSFSPEKEESLRFAKHTLTSYQTGQLHWYRMVVEQLDSLWLLSGGQYVAQKNRELQLLDPKYVATATEDVIPGRDDKEVGWYTTMSLPGDASLFALTKEEIEKQKDAIRTFGGAVNAHELIRQRKSDWQDAQRVVTKLSGSEKEAAERFAEWLRQRYERDAGRLHLQTRMKWIMRDIAKAKNTILSIDDTPEGEIDDSQKAAHKVLEAELARFTSSAPAFGDFMIGRFITTLSKHKKHIDGLAPISDQLREHLKWLRKNSSSAMSVAISGVEWMLRAQTADQLI